MLWYLNTLDSCLHPVRNEYGRIRDRSWRAHVQSVRDLLHVLNNWGRVLESLAHSDIRLFSIKTIICPRSTTKLGWNCTERKLSVSKHNISTISSCKHPDIFKGLRSFLEAYKVKGRSRTFLIFSLNWKIQ